MDFKEFKTKVKQGYSETNLVWKNIYEVDALIRQKKLEITRLKKQANAIENALKQYAKEYGSNVFPYKRNMRVKLTITSPSEDLPMRGNSIIACIRKVDYAVAVKDKDVSVTCILSFPDHLTYNRECPIFEKIYVSSKDITHVEYAGNAGVNDKFIPWGYDIEIVND